MTSSLPRGGGQASPRGVTGAAKALHTEASAVGPRTILALLDDPDRSAHFVERVQSFASMHRAHVVFDILVAAPLYRRQFAPVGAIYTLPAELESIATDSAGRLKALLSRDRDDEVITDMDDVAWLPGDVRHAHRVADLVIAASSDSWSIEWLRNRVLESLILTGGMPLLTLPPGRDIGRFDHAVLGWKPGGPAIRAAREMPDFLTPGAKIDILRVDQSDDEPDTDGTTVEALLRRRGFEVSSHVMKRNHTTADTLQAWALDRGAELLAVGAFAHSRIRRVLMGGVTRALLDAPRIPVLMCH